MLLDGFTMEKKGGCGGDEDQDQDLPPPRAVIEILLWLPVVSLLRFKAVCKSWRALIETSFFIDLHTTTTFNSSSSSSSKFGSFILQAAVRSYSPTVASEHALFMLSSVSEESVSTTRSGSAGCWWSTTRSWVDKQNLPDDYDDRVFKVVEDDNLGGGGGGESNDQLALKLDNLGFPSSYKFITYDVFIKEKENEITYETFIKEKEKEIAGSCNGLVCLHDLENSQFNRGPHEICLWNPATQQFRTLPKSITVDTDPGHHNLVALGFDVQTNDYKVLLLTALCPRWNGDDPIECFCRVQVYSLSTDSWKLLEGIPCLPGYPFQYYGSGLYLNGSCFFLAHFFYSKKQPCLPVNDRFIISFDFTNEIITPIQLPGHHRDQQLFLCYMGDNKIALFTTHSVRQHETHGVPGYVDFNIWVLNEHSSTTTSSLNKGSWTKLHSFQIVMKRSCEKYIPRGISNDGKFALLETRYSSELSKKMNLYNLATKELTRNFLSCGEVMSKAHPYKPSLVSIIGGNGAQQQQHADRIIGNGATNQ